MPTDLNPYYGGGAIVTVIGSVFVLSTYFLVKRTQRHPARLNAWRALCNLGISASLIWAWAAGYHDNTVDETSCVANAALLHFSVLASQAWFAALAIDMLDALHNPFKSISDNMRRNHLI
ncbi:MAG: hypothetical protein MHM6MM_009477, partial [Cercozoa sp. M6MM]